MAEYLTYVASVGEQKDSIEMRYAVHGHTVAELIYERADAEKPHMGLTTWENAPEGKIVKSDVNIAKNYSSEQELRSLERIVSA